MHPLTEQREQLRQRVRAHKQAIADHRRQLRVEAARLRDVESLCRQLGIGLTVVSREGVGAIHGRDTTHD